MKQLSNSRKEKWSFFNQEFTVICFIKEELGREETELIMKEIGLRIIDARKDVQKNPGISLYILIWIKE